jgi:hypothetical protein
MPWEKIAHNIAASQHWFRSSIRGFCIRCAYDRCSWILFKSCFAVGTRENCTFHYTTHSRWWRHGESLCLTHGSPLIAVDLAMLCAEQEKPLSWHSWLYRATDKCWWVPQGLFDRRLIIMFHSDWVLCCLVPFSGRRRVHCLHHCSWIYNHILHIDHAYQCYLH